MEWFSEGFSAGYPASKRRVEQSAKKMRQEVQKQCGRLESAQERTVSEVLALASRVESISELKEQLQAIQAQHQAQLQAIQAQRAVEHPGRLRVVWSCPLPKAFCLCALVRCGQLQVRAPTLVRPTVEHH